MPCIIIARKGMTENEVPETLDLLKGMTDEGADYVEVEVRTSSDGVPFVCGGDVPKESMEMRQSEDLLSEDDPHMMLDDILGKIKGKAQLDIRTLSFGSEYSIMPLLRKHDVLDQVMITSSDPICLKRARVMEEDIITGLFLDTLPREISPIAKFADYALIKEEGLWTRDIEAAHNRGLEIMAWTVDDKAKMGKLIGAGIDGLITTQPGIVKKIAGKR